MAQDLHAAPVSCLQFAMHLWKCGRLGLLCGFCPPASSLSLCSSCRIRGGFLMSSSSSTPKTSHHLRVILSTSCCPSVTFQISPQLNFSFTSQLLSAPSISALPGCYLRRCHRRKFSSLANLARTFYLIDFCSFI